MNIKEIARKAWYSKNEDMPADGMSKLAEFAEALVAELAKGNKPVAYLNLDKLTPSRMVYATGFRANDTQSPVYAMPPTAEQIEQETAEVCVECDPKHKDESDVFPLYRLKGDK